MNSDAEIEKKGTCASPATALASSVFTLPGGPESSTPRGIFAPSRRYLSGSRRKSTISVTSPLTSSMPATSANVVLEPSSGLYNIARERPNVPSAPPAPPPAARRLNATSSQTSSRVGPNPSRSCCHSGGPSSGDVALTDTPALCNCRNSASLAKLGRCVVNRVTCSAAPSCGVYATALVNEPWIISPVDVIAATFFACTWVRKKVYDTVARAGGDRSTEEMIQLTASSAINGHQALAHLPPEPPPGRPSPSTRHGGRSGVAGCRRIQRDSHRGRPRVTGC